MKKSLGVLFCLLFFTGSVADEIISTREAGAYQTKSIAFLNTVIQDEARINPQFKSRFASILQDAVRWKRFDYNNIPQNVSDKFSQLPSSIPLEERMQRTIIPAVLEAVAAEGEIRALALLSEQQRNSFIVVKARELGYTEEELNAVMNAAYIFAPVYRGHSDTVYTTQVQVSKRVPAGTQNGRTIYQTITVTETRTVFSKTVRGGGYWWRIDVSGEKLALIPIGKFDRSASSSVYLGLETTPANYREVTFMSAARKIAEEIELATIRNVPDFWFTAQVLHRNPRNVVISIGQPEGVRADDKFRIIESRENKHGEITHRKRGWIMVKKVGEAARGLDSSQSRAQIISGFPYVGSTIKEIPHFPIDVKAGFGKNPFALDGAGRRNFALMQDSIDYIMNDTTYFTSDSLKNEYIKRLKRESFGDIWHFNLSNMYGPRIKVSVNPLTQSGISQFWTNIGGGIFFGKASGTLEYAFVNKDDSLAVTPPRDSDEYKEYELDGVSFGFAAEGSISKKMFIRRLVLAPEVGIGVKSVSIFSSTRHEGDITDTNITMTQFAVGLMGNMGLEYAVAPILHIGGNVGFHLYSPGSNKWRSSWDYKVSDDKHESHRGLDVKSSDKLLTSGVTWSAYALFTIPRRPNSARYQRMR